MGSQPLKFHDVSKILKNEMEFLAVKWLFMIIKIKRSYEVGTDINKRFHANLYVLI